MADLDLAEERDQLREALIELLLLIMDEDCAYIEGGPQQLDEAAWRIARSLPEPPPAVMVYLESPETTRG